MKKLHSVKSALFLMMCATSIHAATIFETIDELKAYAKSHPESVPLGNLDYLNPDYTKFFASETPSALDKLLITVGLKHKSEWQPKPFLDLLHRVTEKRKKDGMAGAFIQRQEVSQDDHFLVWGNLQGAYHSLVSALESLIEQKIIDKNLKLIMPKYFMVFSGNVVDRSPYSLETLTIVLRLLDANPTRVFYIRGDHETNDKWQDFDLRDELEAKIAIAQGKFPPYVDGNVPSTEDINALFDTLPVALYLGMKTVDSANGIRLSHLPRETFQLSADESQYVLNADNQTIFTIPIAIPKERGQEKPGSLIALTEGSSEVIPNYNAEGLRLLPPDQGVTAWSILSAQTDCYQKLYNFKTDSYADVTIALPMQKTSITHHYQEVPARTGFKTGRVYNMFSGQSVEQFNAQQKIDIIRVGTTIDLSDQAAILGRQVRNGLGLAINKQNKEGIIPGHIIIHTLFNDTHALSKVRRNVETLVKDFHTTILLGIEENIMAREYLDLVTKNNLLVLFPFTGMDKLRSAEYTNIIHYGPSYKYEADISTRYILDTIAPDSMAVFYEKGQMGEDALMGVRAVCKEKGFTALTEIPFMSNLLDFKGQIEIIKRENPGVIGIFSSAEVGQEFIRQVGVQNLAQRTLYALSSFGSDSFRGYYKSRGLRIITTNLVPDPYKSDLPIVQEYRKEASENNVIASPQILEAYINASILVEAMRIIKGPITNQSIKKTLESMKNYDFKGLKLNFNQAERYLSETIWLDVGNGEEWKPFTVNKYTISEEQKIESIREVQEGKSLAAKAIVPAPQVATPAPKIEMAAPKTIAPAPKITAPMQKVAEPVSQGLDAE